MKQARAAVLDDALEALTDNEREQLGALAGATLAGIVPKKTDPRRWIADSATSSRAADPRTGAPSPTRARRARLRVESPIPVSSRGAVTVVSGGSRLVPSERNLRRDERRVRWATRR